MILNLKSTAAASVLALVTTACTAQTGGATSKMAATQCTAGKELGPSNAGLKQVQLCIQSGKITRSYTVEVAITSREQAQGLMFRKSLADDAGMIFPFPEPKPASFWMKNTVIPLDIIFIRADGTIESIAENTTPYSETPVSSGEPVKAVLELRGGLTTVIGVKPGDKVSW
jgi:uncharacterized protein